MIYKLLLPQEWAELQARCVFEGSAADRKDGFIHFSAPDQVRETASKHFSAAPKLVLAEVDPARLPKPPVWEPSRGGRLFPHLYASLPLAAVTRTWSLSIEPDGSRRFPDGVPATT